MFSVQIIIIVFWQKYFLSMCHIYLSFYTQMEWERIQQFLLLIQWICLLYFIYRKLNKKYINLRLFHKRLEIKYLYLDSVYRIRICYIRGINRLNDFKSHKKIWTFEFIKGNALKIRFYFKIKFEAARKAASFQRNRNDQVRRTNIVC